MAGFQRGDNAFELGDLLKCFERFIVCHCNVLGTMRGKPESMFRADAGVIQPSGDAVDDGGLAVVILEYETA